MIEGKHFDDRFTGTWVDEVFCESQDVDVVVDDVIQKRLHTCSTYAGVNDLVELPEHISVSVVEERLTSQIFHVCNQWGYVRDVIVGDATFIRYRVDLRECENVADLQKRCYEFIRFSLKKVVENHCDDFDLYENILRVEQDKIKRLTSKHRENPKKHKGMYVDDLYPEIVTDEYEQRMVDEARATIEKISQPPEMADEYNQHLYQQEYDEYDAVAIENAKKWLDVDHTKYAYPYPLFPDTFGCVIDEREELSNYYRYDELFQKGANVECLLAEIIQVGDEMDDFGRMDMCRVLRGVFGYD